MRTPFLAAATACLLAMGLPPDASAVTIAKYTTRNPAGACMLSIPTTNTGVRPKATGFRNEGTVSNFVICSFDVFTDNGNAGYLSLNFSFASIDGAAHDISCTAMDRGSNDLTGDYSTKNVSVLAGGVAGLGFAPSDFPNLALVGWNASVTCNLPPGTSIFSMYSTFSDNVGA